MQGYRRYSCVGLSNTAAHATENTSDKGTELRSQSIIFQFGRGEKEDSTLRRSFNPRLKSVTAHKTNSYPRNKTLIIPQYASPSPGLPHSGKNVILSIRSHMCLQSTQSREIGTFKTSNG
jgi:nitrate reductase cytochrome c-type subunit